jgi:hypothetical protein
LRAASWSELAGSYAEGALTRPASVAASTTVSLSGVLEKKTCAAAKMPYARWPKYAELR